MMKLWSHLLKTSVMHFVIKKREDRDYDYWNNRNLVVCFVDSLQNLLDGLKRGVITDVFFPEVNLLKRIKSQEVLENVKAYLEKTLRRYNQTNDINVFF